MTGRSKQEELSLAAGVDPMRALLVDAAPAPLPRVWTVAGTTWAIVHLLILLFGRDPNALLISSLAGLAVAIGASISGAFPRLRSHPAAFPALLLGLALLVASMFSSLKSPGDFILRQWAVFAIGVLVTPWLLRTRFAIRFVAVILLVSATLLAVRSLVLDLPASWIVPRSRLDTLIPLLPYRFAAYTAVQLILLVLLVPWVIAEGKKVAYAAAIPFALVVYSVVALSFELPGWLRSLPERLDRWDIASPATAYTPLLPILMVIVLLVLGKQTLKERKRWREEPWLNGLLTGGSLAAMALFIVLFALPIASHPWVMTAGGFAVGLGFAARERLIYDDITRHPRRRPTPWEGYLEEFGIALLSLGTAALRFIAFRRPVAPAEAPHRLLIHPESSRLFCPYKTGRPRWVPLVFHMHSNRWEGAFTPWEMADHYSRLGAGAVILTDHNRITATQHPFGGIPAYEHGWGPHHHHILALGAERTLVDRYPYGGPLASRAETLKRLRGVSRFLVLAHPRHREGWLEEDVTRLDYDAIELFNKSVDGFEPWDEALSAGLLVWGTAGDDCHDLRSRHQTGKRYLLLDLRGRDSFDEKHAARPEAVYAALREGRFVAVRHLSRDLTRSLPGEELPLIERFEWKAKVLRVVFDRDVNYAEVVGVGGEVHGIHKGKREFELSPAEGEGYARLVVYHGDHTLTLNPVARVRRGADLKTL